LDELWFLVSPQNPLKANSELLPAELRLLMVQAAVNGYKRFKASNFEFSLPVPSYTVTTLKALKRAYPERSFHLIIGADSWASISKWKDYKMLLDEFPVIVYPRKGFDSSIPNHFPLVRTVNAPLIEVSSSFIRHAIANGNDVRFFLPETVRTMVYNYLQTKGNGCE